ncbi:restriction endonuclease subunit S [Raoultella terrigena]|uniref:restriction endonuclease subunit S n=1 Tax=Raoultella terrigena TaxID=577 RepID=UPI000F4B6A30|nr:restriction endonuclease subunit S [Raoultella terrigena]ROR94420.1 type I restriction enzyme S subunit [Raoultella terrigena]
MTEQRLPEGWQMVKFGDIAKHISKRVEPSETDLEIYVGLEHLDPDSLKIKRHGTPSDVEGQKLLVKKGQIIFGKRRAYQRKVAVADWDCICSAHAMVLEANPKSVIPEFLPFFMQSDVFMNRAVAISEGSLSPTIKWKTLAVQSFLFPTIEKQLDLLPLLESLATSELRALELLYSAKDMLYQSLRTMTGCNEQQLDLFVKNKLEWKIKKLGRVVSIHNNRRKPISEIEREKITGSYPYYGPTGIVGYINEYGFDGEFCLIGEDGDHFLKYRNMAMTQMVSGKFNVNNHAHVIVGSAECSSKWFFYYFYHCSIYKYLTRQGAGRYKLTKQVLENIDIAIPPEHEMHKLTGYFDSLLDTIKQLQKNYSQTALLNRSGKNVIFGLQFNN